MLVDLLRSSTTTTGAGNLTLSRNGSNPTPADHPIFSVINGLEIGYSIKTNSGVVLETGVGTLSSNGTVLARTYVSTKWNPSTTTLSVGKNLSATNLTESSHTIEFGLNSVNVFADSDVRDASLRRLIFPEHLGSITSSTISMTALTVYYLPFKIKSLTLASGFTVRHSGASAPNYVCALHQKKMNGNPGPIIYSSASAAISTLEGHNDFPFIGGNKLIPPGDYFTSICCDATDTLFRATATSSFNPTKLGCNSTNNFQPVQYLTETITAPMAIPPAHGTLSEIYTSYVPVVAIKSA
jgi:hypothetical protein